MTLTQASAKRKGSGLSLKDCIDLQHPLITKAELPKANWWALKKAVSYKWLAATYFGNFGDRLCVGSRFNATTRHGIIDIDKGSPWHNDSTAIRLLQTCETLGLKCIWLRSSFSGGWHFLFTFSNWLDSGLVSAFLKKVARSAGITDAGVKGRCEVYPNTQYPMQSVRLPFGFNQCVLGQVVSSALPLVEMNSLDGKQRLNCVFKAFGSKNTNHVSKVSEWVGSDREQWLTRTRQSGATGTDSTGSSSITIPALDTFLVALPETEWTPSPELVKAYDITSIRKYKGKRRKFDDPENNSGARRFDLGLKLWNEGLTEAGSRNEALLAVGFMLFMAGVKDADERVKLLVSWLHERHNGKSAEWLEQQDKVLAEIVRMCHWRPYGLTESQMNRKPKVVRSAEELKEIAQGWNGNNKNARSASTLKVVAALELVAATPSLKITYATVLAVSSVSKATLSKIVQQYNVKLAELGSCSEVRQQFSTADLDMMKQCLAPRLALLMQHSPPQTKQCASGTKKGASCKTSSAPVKRDPTRSTIRSKKNVESVGATEEEAPATLALLVENQLTKSFRSSERSTSVVVVQRLVGCKTVEVLQHHAQHRRAAKVFREQLHCAEEIVLSYRHRQLLFSG